MMIMLLADVSKVCKQLRVDKDAARNKTIKGKVNTHFMSCITWWCIFVPFCGSIWSSHQRCDWDADMELSIHLDGVHCRQKSCWVVSPSPTFGSCIFSWPQVLRTFPCGGGCCRFCGTSSVVLQSWLLHVKYKAKAVKKAKRPLSRIKIKASLSWQFCFFHHRKATAKLRLSVIAFNTTWAFCVPGYSA